MKSKSNTKISSILLWLGSQKLLRFVSPNLEWADFRVTETCNSKCVTCNAWKNNAEDEMSTQEAKDALRQLRDAGVGNLVFIGGEPLLRNDIGELIREASLLKFRNIIIVTNGLLLENKAKELLRNGVTHITVSVDGIGSTNDKIRGIPGSFDRSIRGIEAVQRLKKELGLDVSVTIITTLLLKQNVDEIPKLVELSRSMCIHWFFNLLDPNLNIFKGIPFSSLLVENEQEIDKTINWLKKTCKNNPDLIPSCDHMLEFARSYLKDKNRYDFHCIHGYKSVYVGSHGEIYAGCYAMEPIGNLRKSKLTEIVLSESHRKLAKRMFMMDCPGCSNRYELNIATKHLPSHHFLCEKRRQTKTNSIQKQE